MAIALDQELDLMDNDSLIIHFNGKVLAYATSVNFDLSADTNDVSSKFSGQWKANKIGKKSYTISSDFLYVSTLSGTTTFTDIFDAFNTKTPIEFQFGKFDNTLNTFVLTKGIFEGTGIIKSLSLKSEKDNVATCSVSLEGTGPIEKLTIV